MLSFRATIGLTRSIGLGRGKKGERNKWKRQPGRTSARQRREWQLNEQREEISLDVEEREEIFCSLFENEKEREQGSNLRRQRPRSCQSESSRKARHKADSFEPAE